MGSSFNKKQQAYYVWLNPFAAHLKLSHHWLLISYTPIQNKKNLKKDIATVYVRYVLPMFSSNGVIVSSLRFRFLIRFEFLFVYGVREYSNFILLLIYVNSTMSYVEKESKREWTYVYI